MPHLKRRGTSNFLILNQSHTDCVAGSAKGTLCVWEACKEQTPKRRQVTSWDGNRLKMIASDQTGGINDTYSKLCLDHQSCRMKNIW